MAVTVTRSRWNVRGASYGIPNNIIYYGPTFDMTAGSSPITTSNTWRVWRVDETTGNLQFFDPANPGGSDFVTMDRGSAQWGRGYTIIGKDDFILPHASPGST